MPGLELTDTERKLIEANAATPAGWSVVHPASGTLDKHDRVTCDFVVAQDDGTLVPGLTSCLIYRRHVRLIRLGTDQSKERAELGVRDLYIVGPFNQVIRCLLDLNESCNNIWIEPTYAEGTRPERTGSVSHMAVCIMTPGKDKSKNDVKLVETINKIPGEILKGAHIETHPVIPVAKFISYLIETLKPDGESVIIRVTQSSSRNDYELPYYTGLIDTRTRVGATLQTIGFMAVLTKLLNDTDGTLRSTWDRLFHGSKHKATSTMSDEASHHVALRGSADLYGADPASRPGSVLFQRDMAEQINKYITDKVKSLPAAKGKNIALLDLEKTWKA